MKHSLNSDFRQIFSNKVFHLPIMWDNKDFYKNLKKLFEQYEDYIKRYNNRYYEFISDNFMLLDRVKKINRLILKVVADYLNGFPSEAFKKFKKIMEILEETPLKTYEKTVFDYFNYVDPLHLYRITTVNDIIPYDRTRVFHTPYNLRSKISTNRYSIAGYPSLYLGTSLELCNNEINYNPHEKFGLAARFQLERNFEVNQTEIKVIDLAIKPQDFFIERNIYYSQVNKKNTRIVSIEILDKEKVKLAYLIWYPLIASCSYIRVNKKDPFAVEYIIPQMLMQWVRMQMDKEQRNNNLLVGIRYFSCASIKSSDMGFNYVFPSSGNNNNSLYCPILSKSFKLTKPYFIHEYENLGDCQDALQNDSQLDFIK